MKTDRLLAIAMILLYRRTSTVGDLARQFGVSERTIYRDLTSLDCSGFPLVSSPGRGGGIGLLPGYRIENHLFAPGSLAVLASTLSALGDLLDDETMDRDARLALGAGDGASQELIRLDLASPGYRELAPLMRELTQAMRESRLLEIEYIGSGGGQAMRRIEALRLIFWSGDWYLQAWCLVRSAYRMFRLRRVMTCRITDQLFDRSARLADLPDPQIENTTQGPPIGLRIDARRPDLALRFTNQAPPAAENGNIEVEISWPINEWLVHYLSGLAPEVKVVRPTELRRAIADRLSMAVKNYENPQQP